MRKKMCAACAALGMQMAYADNLQVELAAGPAEQQSAHSGIGVQLAATWWVSPSLGIEFMLGRGSGHDGAEDVSARISPIGDVWVDSYIGLGVRHRFEARAAGWQPFVRAGIARVDGTAELVLVSSVFPPDGGIIYTEVHEFETEVHDTSPYVGFGATRRLGAFDVSVQLQHLATSFGGDDNHARTELLFGLGWSL